MTSVVTGEVARCGVIGIPSVSWHYVVWVARKRYHPRYTLHAQGRMHVQMKVPMVRAGRLGGLKREELLTDFCGE
jgi:hypothetical protein